MPTIKTPYPISSRHLPTTLCPCSAFSTYVANHPVHVGISKQVFPVDDSNIKLLYNLDVTCTTSILSNFDWAVYGFNSGHFISNIKKHGLTFCVVLICDPFAYGRSIFQEVYTCPAILPSAPAMLYHIRGRGITAPMSGYLIPSHCYSGTKLASQFWEVQANMSSNSVSFAPFQSLWHGYTLTTIIDPMPSPSPSHITSNSLIRFSAFIDSITGTHWLTKEGCKPLELHVPQSGKC